jgi:hypothetical protein
MMAVVFGFISAHRRKFPLQKRMLQTPGPARINNLASRRI